MIVALVAAALVASLAPGATIYAVTTLAGAPGTSGAASASSVTTANARFNAPSNSAYDSAGNLFVCDTANQCIRRIDTAGNVTVFAGTSGATGRTNATGAAARFNNPTGIAIDASNNLYIADTGNNEIRRITTAGAVTLYAGSSTGAAGTTNGALLTARFNGPSALTFDSSRANLYVADATGNRLRKIVISTSTVSTLVTGAAGEAFAGVAADSAGNIYASMTGINQVREYSSAGATVLTWGNATAGTADGTNTTARFSAPRGLSMDATYLYIADTGNHTIRRAMIASPYTVTTIVGTAGTAGTTNGNGTAARFNGPTGVALSGANIAVSDKGNHAIRNINIMTVWLIAPSASANGTISPNTTQTVTAGSNSATFTITPNTGYRVSNVNVDGSSVGTVTAYRFTNVSADHSIVASFAINTYTIGVGAGSGGSISPSTAQVVNYGGSLPCTITPNTGYHIASVVVDGSSVGTATTYTFSNVTAPHTISATFAINTYAVTSSAGANGSISPSGVTSVNYGGGQAYTITPNTGYHVVGVLVDGTSVGTVTSYAFSNVTAPHTISATFALNQYTIGASAGIGGTISPNTTQTVGYGGSQSYTFTPNTGSQIVAVVVDGSSVGTPTSYAFSNVTANHTIAVTFGLSSYVISVAVGAHGAISPMAPSVAYGSDQTFAITPNTGYHVQTVTIDGVDLALPTMSYTFYNVRSTHTISATFAADTRTLSYSAGAHGSVSGATSQTVAYSGSGTAVTAVPATGYHFVTWSDGVTTATRTDSNVTANISVSATFAANTFTLSYTAGAHGSISGTTSQTVSYGGVGTAVTAVPATGYRFVSWSDGVTTATRTDSNVMANVSVSATFAANTWTLTYSAGAHGTVSGTSPQIVAYGGSGTPVTGVPATGYHFLSWSDGLTTVTRTDTSVTANITVSATFAANTSTLTVTSATAASSSQIDVVFSAPVNASTVQATDFTVNELAVSAAVLQADNTTVRLTCGTQVPGKAYTLTVGLGSVTDLVGGGVSAPNTASFTGHSGPWTGTNAAHGVVVSFGLAYDTSPVNAGVPSTLQPPPTGKRFVYGSYYDVTTTTNFDAASGFTITLPYDPFGLAHDPHNLKLYHRVGSSWVDVTTGVDTANHTVSGHAQSFSDYAVGEDDGPVITSTPASSDWSIALLAALGVALVVKSRGFVGEG